MNSYSCMRVELEKIAKTRAAREAEKMLAAGDTAGLQELGRAHASLGLAPRQVGDLGTGAEGVAQLMLGSHPDLPNSPGLHVRKLYNPTSPISRGEWTTKLLANKLEATKAMQEAAERQGGHVLIPDMGGVTVRGQGDMLRHTSVHDYVPDIQTYRMRDITANPALRMEAPEGGLRVNLAHQALKDLKLREAYEQIAPVARALKDSPIERVRDVLTEARKKTGKSISDAIILRAPFGLGHLINPGNVVEAGGRPAVLDVLPMNRGEMVNMPYRMLSENLRKYVRDGGSLLEAILTAQRPEIANSREIQREVFNPSRAFHVPAPLSLADILGVARRAVRENLLKRARP